MALIMQAVQTVVSLYALTRHAATDAARALAGMTNAAAGLTQALQHPSFVTRSEGFVASASKGPMSVATQMTQLMTARSVAMTIAVEAATKTP